jgi:tetratricopeptide (TPR) repeat protein
MAGAWSRLAEGRAALQADRVDEAERTAREVLQATSGSFGADRPESVERLAARAAAATLLGSALLERGRDEQAREAFGDAVVAFDAGGSRTGRGVVAYAEGVALLGVGRPDDAERVLRRAFDQGEDTPDLRRTLATAIAEQGRIDEAYQLLEAALPRAVHDWRAWLLFARLGDDLGVAVERRTKQWLHAAEALEDAGRLRQAADAFERADTMHPDPTTLYRLANVHLLSGRADAALDALDRAEQLAPSAPARMLAAECLASLGQQPEAVDRAHAAVALAPNDVGLLERQAAILMTAGRYSDLLEVAAHLCDLSAASGLSYRGVALLRTGDIQGAVTALTAAVDARGDLPILRGLLAEALSAAGAPHEAVAHLDVAVQLDPEYVWARASRAALRADLGDRPRARDELLALVDEHPDFGLARAYLGAVLSADGRNSEARAHLRRALELDERQTWVWLRLAHAAVASNDPDEAAACYARVIDQDPQSVPALIGLAEVLMDSGDPTAMTQCEELLHRAADLEPSSPVVHAMFGELLRRRDRPEDAIHEFDQALSESPDFAYALGSRGQAQLAAGRAEDAVRDLERARALTPDVLWLYLALADAHIAMGNEKAAEELLKQAARVDPHSAEPWFRRARIRRAAGRPEKAEPVMR